MTPATIAELLAGRQPLRCDCGQELLVEEVAIEGGSTMGRFLPCKCGSKNDVYVPPGSIVGGFEGAPFLNVWGPRKES
jgi:hypothetical protein